MSQQTRCKKNWENNYNYFFIIHIISPFNLLNIIIDVLSIYLNNFLISSSAISHNVLAVYDVLPARIRACVARPGLAKCAGATAWEWSVAE
jgi:uncharacterized membrane protein YdjX (TVP38/TMEM64 family)